MKICIACGMPMNTLKEFALGDEKRDYCIHCARPDGSMQSYDEKLKSLVDFIVKTQGLDANAACNAAKGMMSKLPAWRV